MTFTVTIDADFHSAIKHFAVAAEEAGVPWLVVGATARVLLLEKVYGWPTGIATEDTDFAVQVNSWDHYEKLCKQFAAKPGIEPLQKPAKRFRAKDGRKFDLLPYGGVEENNKQVFWPPEKDYLMTVRGFHGAAKHAMVVQVNGDTDVPVASPAGLMALKLFAWEERHPQHRGRDAKDIAYLLKHIEKLISAETVYEEFAQFAEMFDYKVDVAAIAGFGTQVASILEPEEVMFLAEFLTSEFKEDRALVAELARFMKSTSKQEISERLGALHAGLTYPMTKNCNTC